MHSVGKMAQQRVEERIASCMRGYNIYNGGRTATVGKILRRARATVDRYTVIALKDGKIVGHLLKKVPKVYFHFFQLGGLISCGIAGARRYSKDVHVQQGGIEVPCNLIVKGRRRWLKL